jgi:hypothetical protein
MDGGPRVAARTLAEADAATFCHPFRNLLGEHR